MIWILLLGYAMYLLPPKHNSRDPAWVVNEIDYAPVDNALEFIELLNVSTISLNLCAYAFSDSRNQIVSICEGQQLIPAGGYAVLARDAEALRTLFSDAPIFEPSTWPALNNSGDTVRLYDETGALIEEVAYAPSWGGQGGSLERIDPAGPSSNASNWATSTDAERSTPGRQNSRYAPDRSPPSILFAERTTPTLVTLVWNEPLDEKGLIPDLFRLGSQSAAGLTIQQPTSLLLTFESPSEAIELDIEPVSDLTGNVSVPVTYPLSIIPDRGDIIINEVLFEPNADPFDHLPDQPEYVEIQSVAPHPLSLRTLALTGQANEKGDADTLTTNVPYPVLQPGDFAVIYAKISAETANPLQSAFPRIEEQTLLLPVEQSSLRLDNRSDLIRIMAGSDTILDELAYENTWHHPSLAVTRGIALERRTTLQTFPVASNWSSSLDASGGTPGRVNSLFAPAQPQNMQSSIRLAPDPFSPDGDGFEDVLFITPPLYEMTRLIKIIIFDSRGREVRVITSGTPAGPQDAFSWDGKDNTGAFLPPGIYIVFLEDLRTDSGKIQRYKKTVVLARSLR